MTKPIGTASQTTAETWEIAGTLINLQAQPALYKDENGVYHTISAHNISLETIAGGTMEITVMTGEIVELAP